MMKKLLITISAIATMNAYAQMDSGAPTTTGAPAAPTTLNQPPACTGVFAENFENGLTAGWSLNAGAANITGTNPAEGDSAVVITRPSGGSTFWSGIEHQFPASTPSYVSFWVKTDHTNMHTGYFLLGDASVTTNNGIVWFYIQNTGNLRISDGSSYQIFPATAGVWYHVELRNMNWTTRTYDYYVNGNLVGSQYGFKAASTHVSDIHLFNYTAGGTSYFDHIVIGEGLSVGPSLTHNMCSADTNGSISLNVGNSSGPYTVNWASGDTSEVLTGLTAGTYSVTVADSACTINDTFTITSTYTSPTVNLGGDQTVCQGTSVTLSVADTNFATILWSDSSSNVNYPVTSGGMHSVTVTDTNGCTANDAVNITFQNCTGVEELNSNHFSLYPNPNNGLFNVELTGASASWNIEVLDITGKSVYVASYNNNNIATVDARGFEKGIYIVRVSDAESTLTKRMIIK